MTDNPTKANLIAKTLFIAGGIILFIVLVILIFRIVPPIISNISNVGSGIKGLFTDEKITVTPESNSVTVQSPVKIAFEYTPKQEGVYYVEYSCIDGLFFDIQSKDGPKRIICETPFKLGSNLKGISIIPTFTNTNTFTDAQISIFYKDLGGNTIARGNTILTIQGSDSKEIPDKNPYETNGALSGSQVTSKPLTQTVQTQTTTYNATKDLVITYIEPINNQSAFVMYVYNYGNTPTGPWEFSYTDAENPNRTIISPIQASLSGQQGLAITVQFDGQTNQRQSIEIIVDPLHKISETNETNNKSNTIITGRSSHSSENNSYNKDDDADLIITTLQVGRISGNRFVEDDEIDQDETAAVRFIVKNQGGESTGSWRFKIDNLPYDTDDTYRSKSYDSLRPGQSLEVIADFDTIDDGRYSIKVEVDSENNVDEEKENNNTKSETLEVNR